MNFACSYFRPIEGRLRDVIIEVATSKKIRVNIEKGKQMLAECEFYEIEPEWLGDTSEDEFATATSIMDMLTENVSEDQKKGLDQSELVNKIMGGAEWEARMKERDKILVMEQNIDKFQYEAATEEILDDYVVKPYAEVNEIEAADSLKHDPMIPCNYYHNDDGFWDEFISYKQ